MVQRHRSRAGLRVDICPFRGRDLVSRVVSGLDAAAIENAVDHTLLGPFQLVSSPELIVDFVTEQYFGTLFQEVHILSARGSEVERQRSTGNSERIPGSRPSGLRGELRGVLQMYRDRILPFGHRTLELVSKVVCSIYSSELLVYHL
jgi:hypothetical protein